MYPARAEGLQQGGDPERAELLLEIARLERELSEKKTLLGVSPHTPLLAAHHADSANIDTTYDYNNNNRGRVGNTSGSVRGIDSGHHLAQRIIPDDAPSINPSPAGGHQAFSGSGLFPSAIPSHGVTQDGHQDYHHQQQGQPQPQRHKDLPQRTGLFGEPLYGQNAVRRPLTTDTSLIQNPVPLIVGGTDGSGTRGVVDLLERLKVPMIVEDTSTKDVHGSPYMAKSGWPAVVRPVVQWAGGAGYDGAAAPAELRRSTIAALGGLKAEMTKVGA